MHIAQARSLYPHGLTSAHNLCAFTLSCANSTRIQALMPSALRSHYRLHCFSVSLILLFSIAPDVNGFAIEQCKSPFPKTLFLLLATRQHRHSVNLFYLYLHSLAYVNETHKHIFALFLLFARYLIKKNRETISARGEWKMKGHSKWLCYGSDYHDDLEYTVWFFHSRVVPRACTELQALPKYL